MVKPERVLVVEDQKSISRFIRDRIEAELNLATAAAYTYCEAQSVIEEDSDFFLAILDLNLPDAMEGEIVDFMLSKQIPSIVLTATFDEVVRERIQSMNVVDYVLKRGAWSIEYLVRTIQRICRNRMIQVLVVDDTASFRIYCKSLLEAHMYDVLEAADGEAALRVLQEHPGIRLVVTDCDMPKMNGLELVAEIRKRYGKEEIAIIGVSAQDNKVLPAKFLKTGANDFIKKPFVFEEFYARVTQNVELMEHIHELKNAAIRDPLTKLYNRRYCLEMGNRLLAECVAKEIPLSVGMLDIDFFKNINDTLGHAAGDSALRYLGTLLNDALGEEGIVSRFGGEEFCMLARGFDPDRAASFFEDLRKLVEDSSLIYKGRSIRFTLSVGVATYLSASLEEMIRCADEMLYRAKKQGRNKVILQSLEKDACQCESVESGP